MFNSKIINILRHFDEKDFKSFRNFVPRALGKTKPRVQKVMQILVKEYPEFDGKIINRDLMFSKVFPSDKSININKLRHVMSDLMRLCEQFLLEKEINTNEFRKHFLLGRAYRKLGLEDYQQTCLDKNLMILESDTRRDSRFYFKKYQIYEDLFRNNHGAKKNNRIEMIESTLKNLDSLFFIEKLKYACELANSQNIREITFNNDLFEDVLKHIEVSLLEEIPVLKIYYVAFKTLIDFENEAHFVDLKHLLNQYGHCFNKFELNEIYIYARNYCVRKINTGVEKYVQELFDFNLMLLKKKNLFAGTYLSKKDYRNLISLGIRLKKFDWVADFIEDYKEAMNPEERENAYVFNKANLEFQRKNYDDTIGLLSQYHYDDTFFKYESKILLAKSYYEQKQLSPLFSLIDAFKVAINRNKEITRQYLDSYKAFILLMPRLMKLEYGSKASIQKIETALEKYPIIHSKAWILEKINEQKKGRVV